MLRVGWCVSNMMKPCLATVTVNYVNDVTKEGSPPKSYAQSFSGSFRPSFTYAGLFRHQLLL
jgi:hypothetical protein